MELETIKQIIKKQIDIDTSNITMDTTFEDLQIDDHFDVIIDSNQNLKSIGDLVKLCQK